LSFLSFLSFFGGGEPCVGAGAAWLGGGAACDGGGGVGTFRVDDGASFGALGCGAAGA
jgi:hypothetical protein